MIIIYIFKYNVVFIFKYINKQKNFYLNILNKIRNKKIKKNNKKSYKYKKSKK